MREEPLRELAHLPARVEIRAILEDLAFLDEEACEWPLKVRRRFLAEGLYRRKFFDHFEECQEMADLWIRLKESFSIMRPYLARLLANELTHYCRAKAVSAPVLDGDP